MNKLTDILFVIIAIMIFAIIVCVAKVNKYKNTISKNEKEIKELSERFIYYEDSLYDKKYNEMYYTSLYKKHSLHRNEVYNIWKIGKDDLLLQSLADRAVDNRCRNKREIVIIADYIDIGLYTTEEVLKYLLDVEAEDYLWLTIEDIIHCHCEEWYKSEYKKIQIGIDLRSGKYLKEIFSDMDKKIKNIMSILENTDHYCKWEERYMKCLKAKALSYKH